MNKRILLVGGGGHCKSVLDTLFKLNKYSEIGIIDLKENLGKKVLGISVIGCDDDLPKFINKSYKYAFVTTGNIINLKLKVRLFYKLVEIGFKIPNIVDPSAILSHNVTMETGVFIGKKAVVNTGCAIHRGSIVNTGAIIEHDCSVGEFAHVAPGTVLCGEVQIGKNTHIGAGCTIKQQLKVGDNSIVGMGSVVLNNIENNVVAYGNPCKDVKKR